MGSATKSVNKLMNLDKEYSGTMKLGETTASYDASEPISEKRPWEHITGMSLLNNCCYAEDSDQQIETSAQLFVGNIKQLPPMFSAVRKEGRRLYEYAREGQTVERYVIKQKPRKSF